MPTGSALATSQGIDITTMRDVRDLVTFWFSPAYSIFRKRIILI